jgi:hypothetical protein
MFQSSSISSPAPAQSLRSGLEAQTMQRSIAVAAGTISQDVVWWKVMSSYRTTALRVALAPTAGAALLVVAAPPASPAPAFDSQGYID